MVKILAIGGTHDPNDSSSTRPALPSTHIINYSWLVGVCDPTRGVTILEFILGCESNSTRSPLTTEVSRLEFTRALR